MSRRLAELTPEQAERQRARQRVYNHRWQDAHRIGAPRRRLTPDERKASQARWRREHRPWIAAYMTAYRPAYLAAHREEILAKKRADYAADPERAIRRANRWKEENPSRARACRMAAAANRRAAECGADGRLSPDDIIELWKRQPDCLGCGDGCGLDHIVPFFHGGQNTTGNIQNLCRTCNSKKGRRLPSEVAA